MKVNQQILKALESESIEILRETAASFRTPVMMYSIGKDSSVLLHLAKKAFYPAPIPFPLLHIDTTWKFKEMYAFKKKVKKKLKVNIITYTNFSGLQKKIDLFVDSTSDVSASFIFFIIKNTLDYILNIYY